MHSKNSYFENDFLNFVTNLGPFVSVKVQRVQEFKELFNRNKNRFSIENSVKGVKLAILSEQSIVRYHS